MTTKPKIAAITGPTASGKSALAVAVAKRLSGEILSSDSMQVYRTMDIGTGKIKENEKEGIPHHLLDILEVEERFSLADFTCLAKNSIEQVLSKGKLPVLCGGTGLYLEHLLENTELSQAPENRELREKLEKEPGEVLYNRLLEVDRAAAEATHPNNRKRVIRALEIYETTGKTKTEWDEASKKREKCYDDRLILLFPKDRTVLYEKINRRVDLMFEEGLVREAESLYHKKYSLTAGGAIGYKELFPYFEGAISLEEAKENIKQASRNYAKRQLTWFRKMEKSALCLDFTTLSFDEMVEQTVEYIQK